MISGSVVCNAPLEANECNALLFQCGQTLLQYIHGRGIGMANTNGMPTSPGNAHKLVKLTIDCGVFGYVIEKNIPLQCIDIIGPGGASGHTFRAGNGIDKYQCLVPAQGFHDGCHRAIITGEPTAHVVVDPHNMGYRLQVVGQGGGNFQVRHGRHQLAWPRVLVFQRRLHRLMQQYFLSTFMCLLCQGHTVLAVRQNGAHHGSWQGSGATPFLESVTQVINNDTDSGC